MSRLVIFFIVFFCACVWSLPPQLKYPVVGDCNSNSTCANNNDCSVLGCSRCNSTTGDNNGTCVEGFSCGQKCMVNSDCNLFSGCDLCQNNVCTGNPKGCGITCVNNNDCSDPICTACINGICNSGYGCGHTCQVSTDCSTTSDCTACIQGICKAPCERPCSQSSDCEPACGNCVNGKCSAQPPATTTTTTTTTTTATTSGEVKQKVNIN